ncbi:MAG: hypothetical protein ACJ8G1_13500 [Vitreoscilla sp.]
MTRGSQTARVDWPKLLDDLVYLGMTGTPLAARLDMRISLLLRIERGERPKGAHADRLVALWCELTGKPLQFVPMTSALTGARVTVTGLSSDEEREPSFLALQAAFMVWGHQPR